MRPKNYKLRRKKISLGAVMKHKEPRKKDLKSQGEKKSKYNTKGQGVRKCRIVKPKKV